MEENEVVEVLNEEVVNTVCDDFSNCGGNPLVGVAVVLGIAALGVGGYMLYKNRKRFIRVKSIEDVEVQEDVDKENEE